MKKVWSAWTISMFVMSVCVLPRISAAPSKVVNMWVSAKTGTTITINWTAPTVSGGTLFTNDLRVSTNVINTLNWNSHPRIVIANSISGVSQIQKIVGLTTNTFYNIAIKCQDSFGAWSIMSAPVQARTQTSANNLSVKLVWSPGFSENPAIDPPVTGFMVYIGSNSGATDLFTNNVGSVTTTIVTNLVNSQTYFFTVQAYNEFGDQSDLSNEVTWRVPDDP